MKTDVIVKDKKVKKRKGLKVSDLQLYSMCLIPILLIFVFNYIPMFGIIIAFKDYKFGRGIFGSEWVGFKNFEFFLKSDDFLRITKNTLVMNALFIVIGIICAVGLAVLLFELKSRSKTKVFQTILITPNFISWVIAAYMLYAILNPQYGMLNVMLSKFGMEKIDFYARPHAWPLILTICSVWKHVGMDSIYYYAALMGVDSSLFEAAEIDGAKKLDIVRYIMIPCLVPLLVMLTILKIGGIFRADFGLFYQMTRDISMLYETTDVLDTYIFRAMRVVGDMGMSSAAGLMQSLVGFVLVMITNKCSKMIDNDYGLF